MAAQLWLQRSELSPTELHVHLNSGSDVQSRPSPKAAVTTHSDGRYWLQPRALGTASPLTTQLSPGAWIQCRWLRPAVSNKTALLIPSYHQLQKNSTFVFTTTVWSSFVPSPEQFRRGEYLIHLSMIPISLTTAWTLFFFPKINREAPWGKTHSIEIKLCEGWPLMSSSLSFPTRKKFVKGVLISKEKTC